MIIAEQKQFDEIYDFAGKHSKILVFGCGTCVTVCMAGGEKEVGILANQLRLAARERGDGLEVLEHTITRQCDTEFFDEAALKKIREVEAVVSLGCGVGVQFSVENVPEMQIFPGLNTKFYGAAKEQGVWVERCAGCGDCVLDHFGGVCPIARCSKSILNGPCGGSEDGKCEADPENIECAWQLIYERMKNLNRLDELENYEPYKNWAHNRDGGPRKKIRKDVILEKG
ncbi:MAG: hypothetical protein GY757_26130 [bacterium]|nr:hypothetical protein [bacterium]